MLNLLFNYTHSREPVCGYLQVSSVLMEAVGFLEAAITGCWEPAGVGGGNRVRVLCKGSMCLNIRGSLQPSSSD